MQNFEFVAPNRDIFQHNFWTQGMVNLFMRENWGQNDPNYHDNLQVALLVQDILIRKRDLHKRKTNTIKTFQATNDPRLKISDFEEEKALQNSI